MSKICNLLQLKHFLVSKEHLAASSVGCNEPSPHEYVNQQWTWKNQRKATGQTQPVINHKAIRNNIRENSNESTVGPHKVIHN